jgi:hypothetical protein
VFVHWQATGDHANRDSEPFHDEAKALAEQMAEKKASKILRAIESGRVDKLKSLLSGSSGVGVDFQNMVR